MHAIAHSKAILKEEDIEAIRKKAFLSEEKKQLTAEVLDLTYQRQWFRIMEPKTCGGLEWPLPKTVQLFEALAWADGNVGWCVNLGAGANMFAGYFNEKTAKEIFTPLKTCCAGSGAITGKARKTQDGYIISGFWKYASGSAHATHFTANCFIRNEHDEILMENGNQVFRSFIFPEEKVEIINAWNVTGLKATSSNNFKVDNIFVPEEHSFSLLEPSHFAKGPLYKVPFDVLAIVNMAVMPTGMALHFIDLFQELAQQKKPLHSSVFLKDNKQVKIIFAQVTNSFYNARNKMYQLLNELWEIYKEEKIADAELINKVSVSAKEAAQKAREVIYKLYPFCGMSIIYTNSELNKVWRDISVAGQHYLLSDIG